MMRTREYEDPTWHTPSSSFLVLPATRISGKERDAESGLDYFGARYYSGSQGRFSSPDKPLMDQHIEDPQSWNLYTYGRNNPFSYVDPTGEAIELIGDDEERKKALALLQKGLGNDTAASRLYINAITEGDKTRYFMKRLPMVFFLIGVGIKAVLVLLWRLFQPPGLYRLLITYDPIGIWMAERVTPLFFDQRRLAPTPSETIFYEVILIVGFGLQFLIVGLIVQVFGRWFRKRNMGGATT